MKPVSDSLWSSAPNEAFCLLLARNFGVQAPEIRIGKVGKRSYLLVSCYDRFREGDIWRRLHQEDFCQAMGHFPSAK
ncbi:HipA domain-containing protein [Paracoccus sp. (in: a-proteobacteria)]|uniref:HipA domain-containing protein n=1 Tax=Paracoccus sp. TaxID=267 RepID=UPI003916DB9D